MRHLPEASRGSPRTGQFICGADGFLVYHAKTDEEGRSPLGWVFIESERHVPYLANLTVEESANLGRLRTELARAIRDVLGAEFVLTFVLGLGVAHFHEHLLPRMPGTPAEVAWYDSVQALPKATAEEVEALAERLRASLGLTVG